MEMMKAIMFIPNHGAKNRIQPQIFTDLVKILTRRLTVDRKTWMNYVKQIGMYLPLQLRFLPILQNGYVSLDRALFTCSSVLSAWVFDGFLKFNWSFGCFGQKQGPKKVHRSNKTELQVKRKLLYFQFYCNFIPFFKLINCVLRRKKHTM